MCEYNRLSLLCVSFLFLYCVAVNLNFFFFSLFDTCLQARAFQNISAYAVHIFSFMCTLKMFLYQVWACFPLPYNFRNLQGDGEMFGLDFLCFCGASFFWLTYPFSFFHFFTLVLVRYVSVCLSLFNAVSIFIIAKSLGIVEMCVTIFPYLRVVCMYVWPVVFFFN